MTRPRRRPPRPGPARPPRNFSPSTGRWPRRSRGDIQQVDRQTTLAYRDTDAQGLVHDEWDVLDFMQQLTAGAGRVKVEHYSVDSLHASLYGTAGVVTDVETTSWATPATADAVYVRFTRTYVRPRGQWQLAGTQATEIPAWRAGTLADRELTPVAPGDGSEEAASKSVDAVSATFHRIKNATGGEVRTYWIGNEGKRDLARRLNAGKPNDISTFVTHAFVVADAGGNCLVLFMPTTTSGLAVVQPR